MMFTILLCATALAGQFVSTRAATIVCDSAVSINITIGAGDTTYHNKTIRAISPCSGTYGPIVNGADVVTIAYCNTASSPFVLDTEYSFLFQDATDYWSTTDFLVAVTCLADTSDQVFNESIGVTPLSTVATITDTIVPVLSLDTFESDGTTPLSVASVGDAVQVAVILDSDYSEFDFVVKRVTAIAGSTSLLVLDNTCVTDIGDTLGFATTAVSLRINIGFSAFITTGSDPISLTGNTVIINVEIGVCASGGAACQQQNCSAVERKRRAVEEGELSELEMSKSLVIFPTKQSENEFLAKIQDQLNVGKSTEEPVKDQVCVDRTTSFSLIAILSGLVVFSLIVVTYMLLRSRQFRGKRAGEDERGFSNTSYRS